jgi:hypothetical protein
MEHGTNKKYSVQHWNIGNNAIFKYFWTIRGILDYKLCMEIGRSFDA